MIKNLSIKTVTIPIMRTGAMVTKAIPACTPFV
jgi:hypothetical protein